MNIKQQMELKVEDLLLDRSFRKWVLEPDGIKNKYWEQYLAGHPENIKIIEEAKNIVQKLNLINYKLEEAEVKEMWSNISDKIELNQDQYKNRNSKPYVEKERSTWNYRTWGRYAAVFILLATAVAVWIFVKPEEQKLVVEQEWVTKETLWGQKSTIYLSDGTEVILNSGSSIKFLKNFEPGQRMVILTGEAFFAVSKDTLRPFRVQSAEIVTQALGTSFNINAYHPEKNVDVALVSGSVLIKSNDNQIVLNPGEKAIYTTSDRHFEKTTFDQISTVGWKDRLLVFKDADQLQVFDKLSKWYGVEFKFSNKSSKDWNYNAEFKNLDLKNVLGSISFAMDFDYYIQDDYVQIKFNNP